MEKLSRVFTQLQASIKSQKIDFELLSTLKQGVDNSDLNKDTFQQFVKLLIEIYELSSNQNLYVIKRTSIKISEMAIQLKALVCRMMTMVILFFEKEQSINLIPYEILAEAIEIMILCARVCLNEASNHFVSQIQEDYNFIHSPFDFVSSLLKENVQFMHHLNVLELIRYKCENQTFSIVEFKNRLARVFSFEDIKSNEYKNFVENIAMEILLKSLKNGKLKPDDLKQFFSYISDQYQKDLSFLVFDQSQSIRTMQNASEFLQIYTQIKDNGIESINIEFLEDFIKNDKNFNDERIFQIAALTLQPTILYIWFNVLNSKKQRQFLTQRAVMCYIYVIDSIISKSPQTNPQSSSKVFKLSNAIAFTLLTQKKQTASTTTPVLSIIKTMVKTLTWLCFSLYERWQDIKDFGERVVLLCSRYQCMEISKVVYAVMLYYCLVTKQKAEDVYEKFIAYHSNEKSGEIYRLLSCAYEIQNHKEKSQQIPQLDESLKAQIIKQPYIAILFAQKHEDMIIFDIESKDFREIPRKFTIFLQMMKKYRNNLLHAKKIVGFLQDFVIRTSIELFSAYMTTSEEQNLAFQELFMILLDMVDKNSPQIFKNKKNEKSIKPDLSQLFSSSSQQSNVPEQPQQSKLQPSQIFFILINLYILGLPSLITLFKEFSSGVLLNKYSIKIKMIISVVDLVNQGEFKLENDIYCICCCYLIAISQKFKMFQIRKERIGEPGEASFVHAVQELVEASLYTQEQQNTKIEIEIDGSLGNSKQKQPCSQPIDKLEQQKQLIIYTIFQINCLTNNCERYFKKIESLPLSLIKSFTQSLYIPKNLKQKILRRIVKKNFLEAKNDVSLKEFREIIEITENQEEVQLYIQYVFSNFGQDGKKMIMLMANQNKKIQKILLNDTDVEF